MTWRFPLGLALVCAVAAPAAAQDQPPETNPCKLYKTALCPDLIMAPPDGLYVEDRANGHVRLHATNHIINVGKGPLEIKGVRKNSYEMQAKQVIHRAGNPPIVT